MDVPLQGQALGVPGRKGWAFGSEAPWGGEWGLAPRAKVSVQWLTPAPACVLSAPGPARAGPTGGGGVRAGHSQHGGGAVPR